MYVSQPEFTIREIAELSGLSFSTLNTFLYGKSKDCKLSTAINLSKAMQVSIDELVGCETLNIEERSLIQEYRCFAPRVQLLIRWFIQFQKCLSTAPCQNAEEYLTIMTPHIDESGHMIPSNDYAKVNVKHLSQKKNPQIFLGLRIPCSDYLPIFSPYDILLLANDRLPKINEICAILLSGKLYLAKRTQTWSDNVFLSIQDNHLYAKEQDLDSILGYVAGVEIDNSFSMR